MIEPGPPACQLFKKYLAPQQMPFTVPTLETIFSAIKAAPVVIDYLEVKYVYGRHSSGNAFITTMQKIPFFNLLPKDKEAAFFQDLLEQYMLELDGSLYDYSHAVCMILKKK